MAEVVSGVTVPELPLLTTGMATDLILMTRAGVGKKMLYSDFCEHVVAVHETAVANGNKTIVDAINEVYSSIGGPNVVRLAARMTDTSKIYVYIGNEADYLTNHWYYWDGSLWANGGVYNATAVQTDTTLSISGTAADSKATGDAISAVANDVSEVQDIISAITAAVSSDVGKVLVVKTVTSGKVTAWEFKDAIEVDPTLSQEGTAADAKAVGEAMVAEASARNTAISSAIASEVSERNGAISSAISGEESARDAAIETAVSAEASARNTAISSALQSEATARDEAISEAIESAVTEMSFAMDENGYLSIA